MANWTGVLSEKCCTNLEKLYARVKGCYFCDVQDKTYMLIIFRELKTAVNQNSMIVANLIYIKIIAIF